MPIYLILCPECNGEGKVKKTQEDRLHENELRNFLPSNCLKSTGDFKLCPECKGKGWIPDPKGEQ
jgi:uncharacterized protein with PIN domain